MSIATVEALTYAVATPTDGDFERFQKLFNGIDEDMPDLTPTISVDGLSSKDALHMHRWLATRLGEAPFDAREYYPDYLVRRNTILKESAGLIVLNHGISNAGRFVVPGDDKRHILPEHGLWPDATESITAMAAMDKPIVLSGGYPEANPNITQQTPYTEESLRGMGVMALKLRSGMYGIDTEEAITIELMLSEQYAGTEQE